MAYAPALEMQRERLAEVQGAADERAYLLLAEHDPPVITLGRRGKAEHVLASRELLAARGIELHESQRGGDVTYHGPGQLVAYPIIRLDPRRRSVHGYVWSLEESVIRLLDKYGLRGERRRGYTGVWVGREKIAAVGVAIQKWVAWHGLALNVGADLSGFDLIVPCGIRGYGVTSLSRLVGKEVEMGDVKDRMAKALGEALGFGRIQYPMSNTEQGMTK